MECQTIWEKPVAEVPVDEEDLAQTVAACLKEGCLQIPRCPLSGAASLHLLGSIEEAARVQFYPSWWSEEDDGEDFQRMTGLMCLKEERSVEVAFVPREQSGCCALSASLQSDAAAVLGMMAVFVQV